MGNLTYYFNFSFPNLCDKKINEFHWMMLPLLYFCGGKPSVGHIFSNFYCVLHDPSMICHSKPRILIYSVSLGSSTKHGINDFQVWFSGNSFQTFSGPWAINWSFKLYSHKVYLKAPFFFFLKTLLNSMMLHPNIFFLTNQLDWNITNGFKVAEKAKSS